MEWEGAFNILHGHASVPAVERSAPRLLLSVVLPLLGLACACTAAPTGQVRILTGLRATLEDTTDPYSTEGVKHWRWRTHWVIQWAPVPDAVAYELIYMTSEGASKKSTRLDAPPFRLEVAKGDNPQTEGMPTRTIQLITIQSLLSVRVVPRMADGSLGPASPWLQAGRECP